MAQAPAAATSAAALDLDLLGTILFLTGGVTRARPSGGDIRATAAAGALYPNELYVVTGPLPALAAGVYHYEPQDQRLGRLRDGDWRGVLAEAADDPDVQRAPATIVLTGILWRSAWKYRERAYRHLHWDGGMLVAHVLAAAQAADLPAALGAAFVDETVDRLVGADGVHEGALALVRLGAPGAPVIGSGTVAIGPLPFTPTPLSREPIDYPEALRYHAASKLETAKAVERIRGARFEEGVPSPASGPLLLPAPARSDASLSEQMRWPARSGRPRERRDKTAEPSHAGPADERPPADEASYAVQEARGPASVNSVGPAAWAADLHAFGVALDRGASKVPLAAGTLGARGPLVAQEASGFLFA